LPILLLQLGHFRAVGQPIGLNFSRQLVELVVEVIGAEPAAELRSVGRPCQELTEPCCGEVGKIDDCQLLAVPGCRDDEQLAADPCNDGGTAMAPPSGTSEVASARASPADFSEFGTPSMRAISSRREAAS